MTQLTNNELLLNIIKYEEFFYQDTPISRLSRSDLLKFYHLLENDIPDLDGPCKIKYFAEYPYELADSLLFKKLRSILEHYYRTLTANHPSYNQYRELLSRLLKNRNTPNFWNSDNHNLSYLEIVQRLDKFEYSEQLLNPYTISVLLTKLNIPVVARKSLPITDQQSNSDLTRCPICLDNEKKCSLQPCHHTCCLSCSERLTKCHICRLSILDRIPFIL